MALVNYHASIGMVRTDLVMQHPFAERGFFDRRAVMTGRSGNAGIEFRDRLRDWR